MAIAISAPYPNFFTPDGRPLEGGYVYIGVEGLNPIANPLQAYWDEALTIPAPAEIRVTGGYIVYNGAPARLYTAGNYSILVADKNGKTIYSRLYNTVYDSDLFLTTPRGTLTRSMRTPASYNINLILDGGFYSWTNAGTSNYPTGCGAADLFALEVFASPDGAGIVYQRIIDITLAYATERYSWERKSIDAGATWSTWQSPLYRTDYVAISPAATPYSVVLTQFDTTILVTTGASAFVCNLPAASGVVGKKVTIIKIDSGAGAIRIAPNGADVIANAGNVSIYLGQQYRNVKLLATASGAWSVVGGEWQPAQSVDTNGTHLALGKLHHLPQNNTTSRLLSDYAAAASGWIGPITAWGVRGIPNGAVAILAKVVIRAATDTAAGVSSVETYFSSSNSYTPTHETSHASIVASTSTAGGAIYNYRGGGSVVVPLDSSGQFYHYRIYTNAAMTTGIQHIYISVLGYYMGD